MTGSFAAAYVTGWESPFTATLAPAQNVMDQPTLWVITRWAMGETEIVLPAIMQSETYSSILPSLLLWLLQKKPPALCLVPADILLPYWGCGHPAALDVSVIPPLQELTVVEAATSLGHALKVAVRRKLTSNLPACRSAGVDFLPIIVETLGGWCPDAIIYSYLVNWSSTWS